MVKRTNDQLTFDLASRDADHQMPDRDKAAGGAEIRSIVEIRRLAALKAEHKHVRAILELVSHFK